MNVCRTTNDHLYCNVCKINFGSNADYALHEFSKKHCHNLIKIAKHKSVRKKKITNEVKSTNKDIPSTSANAVTHSESIPVTKYDSFVSDENCKTDGVFKESYREYNPHLQEFSETSFKEKIVSDSEVVNNNETTITAFCGKEKNNHVKSCRICDIIFTTVPEYESHIKSPRHIWKMKENGRGISAYFVKASQDLHTTDGGEVFTNNNQETNLNNSTFVCGNLTPTLCPLLYCYDCNLLLTSPEQFNTHISGSSHKSYIKKKKKAEMKFKEKLQTLMMKNLYCYSCKVSLNNVPQYNEHKNGKKHKIKCLQLMKKGITIPPEERVIEWHMPTINPKIPVVYPDLYEKFVHSKQKEVNIVKSTNSSKFSVNENDIESNDCKKSMDVTTVTDISFEGQCCNSGYPKFETSSDYKCNVESNVDNKYSEIPGMNNMLKNNITTAENHSCESKHHEFVPETKAVTFDFDTESTDAVAQLPKSISNESKIVSKNCDKAELKIGEYKKQIVVLSENELIKCNICNERFHAQSQFDGHLSTEEHQNKILELKSKGCRAREILNILFYDRHCIKPDGLGRYSCSICNVITENITEFELHFTSALHKFAEKEYRKERKAEVKQMSARNEQGMHFCNSCGMGWNSLVEFGQHLHSVKHKGFDKMDKLKKCSTKRMHAIKPNKIFKRVKKNKIQRKEV